MIPIIGIFQSSVTVADQRLARHCQRKILKRCLVDRKRNSDGALFSSLPFICIIGKCDRNFVCSCIRYRHGRRVKCIIRSFPRGNPFLCYPADLHTIVIKILPGGKNLFYSYGKSVFSDRVVIDNIG